MLLLKTSGARQLVAVADAVNGLGLVVLLLKPVVAVVVIVHAVDPFLDAVELGRIRIGASAGGLWVVYWGT